jgi:hypothetical protein
MGKGGGWRTLNCISHREINSRKVRFGMIWYQFMISSEPVQWFETQLRWLGNKRGRSTIVGAMWYYIGHPITESFLLCIWIPYSNSIYVSISWDIKAVPYFIMLFSDGAPWPLDPVRVLLQCQDNWPSAWVWLLVFVDGALYCWQCFETFWKRVIIREAGHLCLMLYLRRRGAVPLLRLYAFMSCKGTA